jgi:SAM-dependent methyltransferase
VDENRELRARNASYWGHIQESHLAKWYDLDGFRAGKCSLRSLEVEAIGDVTGKRLLHLQCNCGPDTLSWARRGAVVTGVDLSEQNIAFARRFAGQVGLTAPLICCDVLDLDDVLEETFDVVFASYGVFCWIDDLDRWMAAAANRLEPGGLFFYVDGHPALWPYNDAGELEYSYFHVAAPLVSEFAEGTDLTIYEWQWTVADIVNAAIRAGLRIEELGEYPFAPYKGSDSFVQDEEGRWRLPEPQHMPMTLSVKARKRT